VGISFSRRKKVNLLVIELKMLEVIKDLAPVEIAGVIDHIYLSSLMIWLMILLGAGQKFLESVTLMG